MAAFDSPSRTEISAAPYRVVGLKCRYSLPSRFPPRGFYAGIDAYQRAAMAHD